MYIVTAKKDTQDVHYPTVLHLLYYGPPKNQTPTEESDGPPQIRAKASI